MLHAEINFTDMNYPDHARQMVAHICKSL